MMSATASVNYRDTVYRECGAWNYVHLNGRRARRYHQHMCVVLALDLGFRYLSGYISASRRI